MGEFIHKWEHEGEVITFSWLGEADIRPDRVYALAFTPEGQILLVSDEKWYPAGWLPGGGVKNGETAEQALARELTEEANAVVWQSAMIGIQQVENSAGDRSYHAIYWCRITLDNEFTAEYEVTERMLVHPELFISTLFWGKLDPKAEMLLERALEIENRLSAI